MIQNAFSIDLRKMVLLLMPTALRKKGFYHLIYKMLTPMVTVYREFYKRRVLNLYTAKYDSGVGNIRRMISALYQVDLDDVRIVNSEGSTIIDKRYLTIEQADDAVYLGEGCYLDGVEKNNLFTVYIPSSLSAKADEIKTRVAMYTLPGIGFEIVTE